MSIRFIKERQNVSGIDYAKCQREENAKYTITRLSDGAVSYRDRLPRCDSKFWSYNFMIWDQEANQQISRRGA